MNKSALNRPKTGRLTLAAITAALTLMSLSSAHAVLFDLGEAAGYGAFILPGGAMDMTIKGGSAIDGDVAASAGTHIDLGSGAKVGPYAGTGRVVSGTIYLDPNGATVKLDNQPANSVVIRDLSQAVQDAISANQAAAMLSPTQSLGVVDLNGGAFTINAQGADNVFSLSSFNLSGSAVLTLNGSASDYFVFNITGGFNMSSKSTMVLTGGLTSENILWNFIGDGSTPNIHSKGFAYGTFLAPDRSLSIDDSTLFGSFISSGHMHIGSKSLIVQPPQVIPEISFSAMWIGFAGLICAFHVRRRWTKAAVATVARR